MYSLLKLGHLNLYMKNNEYESFKVYDMPTFEEVSPITGNISNYINKLSTSIKNIFKAIQQNMSYRKVILIWVQNGKAFYTYILFDTFIYNL